MRAFGIGAFSAAFSGAFRLFFRCWGIIIAGKIDACQIGIAQWANIGSVWNLVVTMRSNHILKPPDQMTGKEKRCILGIIVL